MSLSERTEGAVSTAAEYVVIKRELDIYVVAGARRQWSERCRVFNSFEGCLVGNRYAR